MLFAVAEILTCLLSRLTMQWTTADGDWAGYVIQYNYNLTYTTIRASGHMVPQMQPAFAWQVRLSIVCPMNVSKCWFADGPQSHHGPPLDHQELEPFGLSAEYLPAHPSADAGRHSASFVGVCSL